MKDRAPNGSDAAAFSFTCLLPVCPRDDAELLRDALHSIFANTLRPTHTIVCEDGDLTLEQNGVLSEAARELSFERIRNPGAPGLHNNLNHALPYVSTRWICRADADDINAPNRFADRIGFLAANPLVSVLGSDIDELLPDGTSRVKHMPETQKDILKWAIYRNPINHMTVFVATEALRTAGGYPSIPLKEDYALWLRMLAEGYRFANLRKPLVRVRLGADFYRRRSGMRHLVSEARLHSFRAGLSGVGQSRALAASGARMLALATAPAARHIYETRLR
jgi:hypothetical protein